MIAKIYLSFANVGEESLDRSTLHAQFRQDYLHNFFSKYFSHAMLKLTGYIGYGIALFEYFLFDTGSTPNR